MRRKKGGRAYVWVPGHGGVFGGPGPSQIGQNDHFRRFPDGNSLFDQIVITYRPRFSPASELKTSENLADYTLVMVRIKSLRTIFAQDFVPKRTRGTY